MVTQLFTNIPCHYNWTSIEKVLLLPCPVLLIPLQDILQHGKDFFWRPNTAVICKTSTQNPLLTFSVAVIRFKWWAVSLIKRDALDNKITNHAVFIYLSVVDVDLVIPDLLILSYLHLPCFLVPKVRVLVRIGTSFLVVKLVSVCLGGCVRSWSGLAHREATEPDSFAGSVNNVLPRRSETVTYKATSCMANWVD